MPKSRKGFSKFVKIGGIVVGDVSREDESLPGPDDELSCLSELLHTINDADRLFIVKKVIGGRVNGLFRRTKLVIRRWQGVIAGSRQEEPAKPMGISLVNIPCIFPDD